MKNCILYFKKIEWSFGNGQCPECFGLQPRKKWWTETVGHIKNCVIGKCLEELGEKVVWERKNHSKEVRRFKKISKKWWEKFEKENKKYEP